MTDLVTKYNIAAPRYTSYPTLPYWENNLGEDKWKEEIKKGFLRNEKTGISLYIHLPYCESLCTYCACNTRITVNHAVEQPYIDGILKEWDLYLAQAASPPLLRELHLGGGTPTFFSPDNLKKLISGIFKKSKIHAQHDFSFEGHPNNTTAEHLQTLHELGFRRVSFGIQDFNSKIQNAINRVQSFEQTAECVAQARKTGYSSVNFDLVYGLPFQNLASIHNTIEKVIQLLPDRIAFYSYAHVPWLKPGQRKYSEKDLPADSEKRALYELGKKMFLEAGYKEVGMDHFALENDELYTASQNGRLNRNFMGYTTTPTKMLIGLGCSAISDSWTAFSQNIKTVEEYLAAVNAKKFPLIKGHLLTEEDLEIRQQILDLMCKNESNFKNDIGLKNRLSELIIDTLIEVDGNIVRVTETGKHFIRNICLAFDKKYWSKIPESKTFSSTA